MINLKLHKSSVIAVPLTRTKVSFAGKSKWAKAISKENVQRTMCLQALYVEVINRCSKAQWYGIRMIADGITVFDSSYPLRVSNNLPSFLTVVGPELYFNKAGKVIGREAHANSIFLFFSHSLSVLVRASHKKVKMKVYSYIPG